MTKHRISLFLGCTLLLCATLAAAYAWEAPVTGDAADWRFEDAQRCIAISKVQDGDVTYFVADVQLADAALFRTAVDAQLSPVSVLASGANAVLAVNGDDYGVHRYGIVIRGGRLIYARRTVSHMLVVDGQGNFHIKTDRKQEDCRALSQQYVDASVSHTFEFGPELVRDGQAAALPRYFDIISTSATSREPRTAIGQVGPLHYVILVVDGRQKGYSAGVSLPALQELLLRYGAHTAINLDGGGSSELWFQGEILNRPSGGTERSVSDIICF